MSIYLYARPETPAAALLKRQLKTLRASIVHRPPFCQGTIPLTAHDFTLFYGKDREARRVDLSNASPEELQHLANTCDPATFGIDQKDVYDEAYRKAGKLDAQHFALNFSPERTGLIDILRNELIVEGCSATGAIHAELYKLNVYGPQSFFKAHVDTPRSELMFGSLVIVFPTAHEGGELQLRERQDDGTREWTFDSAALLEQRSDPAIAYVAFYSDIEHEVMPIRSGYRVTITYNLYHVKDSTSGTGAAAPSPVVPRPAAPHEQTFKATLQTLLSDPTFLPEGGNLLFCLRHQYPLPTSYDEEAHAQEALQGLASCLKASDALVLNVVQSLALDASLKIVYQERRQFGGLVYIMCDRVVPLDQQREIADLSMHLARCANGQLLSGSRVRLGEGDSVLDVHWIHATPWVVNSTKESFMAYGNEATLAHTYWKVSLLVCIGPAGNRETAQAS
ncbi:hypothetical protein C8Q78DRAFT_974605 [Trametes maxima]|nr:hypothetical protein C8Q78DRAFT_974605 [Trametes maxima]